MQLKFFFGPDKTPFFLNPDGKLISQTYMPFHGIISKGLLSLLSTEKVSFKMWFKSASDLENEKNDSEELQVLKKYVAKCYMLSFSQSVICVKKYLQKYCLDFLGKDNETCEIWHIKEGHTSSVWNIRLGDNQGSVYHFILNVARDHEGGVDLLKSSKIITSILEELPDINMAKVLDIQSVVIRYNGKNHKVVISKNALIEDCFEIHAVFDKATERKQYLLVERFLTNADNPIEIKSIYGRKFNDKETDQIESDIKTFLKQTSKFKTDININEGDVGWDGQRAIIVAIS